MPTEHNIIAPVDFESAEKHEPVAHQPGAEANRMPSDSQINWVSASLIAEGDNARPRLLIVACGIVGMLSWLSIFGMGMLINSKTYREQLARNFDAVLLAKAILTFTPTNVALLAIVAGFLGGCASLLMYSDYDPSGVAKQNGKAPMDEERLAFLRENPISSALRGFVVYLTFLAGTVFGASSAFADTTQDQYCRLAGAVAVLAFGVGYDPTVFRQLISLVARRADTAGPVNHAKTDAARSAAAGSTK